MCASFSEAVGLRLGATTDKDESPVRGAPSLWWPDASVTTGFFLSHSLRLFSAVPCLLPYAPYPLCVCAGAPCTCSTDAPHSRSPESPLYRRHPAPAMTGARVMLAM